MVICQRSVGYAARRQTGTLAPSRHPCAQCRCVEKFYERTPCPTRFAPPCGRLPCARLRSPRGDQRRGCAGQFPAGRQLDGRLGDRPRGNAGWVLAIESKCLRTTSLKPGAIGDSQSAQHNAPLKFGSKCKQAELKERSAAEEPVIDPCHLLGEPAPAGILNRARIAYVQRAAERPRRVDCSRRDRRQREDERVRDILSDTCAPPFPDVAPIATVGPTRPIR